MALSTPSEFRQKVYRLRRFQNWITIGILYSLFYMSRYNFTAIAPYLKEYFGWVKTDLGMFEMVLPLIYGLSVIINGPIADKIGGKKSFLIGAAGVVVMNFLFGGAHWLVGEPAVWIKGADGSLAQLVEKAAYLHGFGHGSTLWLLSAVWAVNGYFQSFGALSIVKINAQWFHISERGTFAAIFGVLIRAGLILAFSGTPFIARYVTWYWAFWIPAALVALLFVLTLLLVKDTPEEAGYPTMETGDAVISRGAQERVTLADILRKVFTSRVMWMIAVSSVMIGLVRRSVVDTWVPLYFSEIHHLTGTSWTYQIASWGMALAGIAGGFVFGIMSDRVFGSRRAPVVTMGFGGMVIGLGLFLGADALGLGPFAAAACWFVLSFFVNGAHGMIGGAASMDFGGRKAVATAAGLFDGLQYFASAPNGLIVGYITQHYGWQVWKIWPVPFAVIGVVTMATLWNVMPKGRSSH
jgi:OPA family glycerol-3-phosphate transporter-like MFS transporter